MKTKQDELKVIFRKWNSDGDIIAIFPTLPGDPNPDSCLSYMHFGQHGSADYSHILGVTKLATAIEYADLLAELQSIYDDFTLKVCERQTYSDFEYRMNLDKKG